MGQFGNKNFLSFTIEAVCWGGVVVSYLSMNLFHSVILDKFLAKLGELSFFNIFVTSTNIDMLNKNFLIFITNNFDRIIFWHLSGKCQLLIMIAFLTFNVVEKPFMSLRVKYTS